MSDDFTGTLDALIIESATDLDGTDRKVYICRVLQPDDRPGVKGATCYAPVPVQVDLARFHELANRFVEHRVDEYQHNGKYYRIYDPQSQAVAGVTVDNPPPLHLDPPEGERAPNPYAEYWSGEYEEVLETEAAFLAGTGRK